MPEKIYTTAEAAEYLGLKASTIRYHLYRSGYLKPDFTFGRTLGFYQSTLDAFKANVPSPGRPPSHKEEEE